MSVLIISEERTKGIKKRVKKVRALLSLLVAEVDSGAISSSTRDALTCEVADIGMLLYKRRK